MSTAVNRTANDNAKLVERLAPGAEPAPPPKVKPPARVKREKVKKDGGQGALF